MYTNSFSVIEIEGGAGFTDQAITIILEPFRIRILVSFSEIRKIWRGLVQVGGLLSSWFFCLWKRQKANKDSSREINFTRFERFSAEISNNKNRDIFLLHVPKEKDFIIRFMSVSAREAFVDLLRPDFNYQFLRSHWPHCQEPTDQLFASLIPGFSVLGFLHLIFISFCWSL